jgi:hypothetical protein
MAGLREASTTVILGSRPLGGISDDLDRVAVRSGILADDMAALSAALASQTVTLDRLAEDVGRIRMNAAEIRDLVLAGDVTTWRDRFGGFLALAVLVVGWLALPAVASLAIGLEQLRRLSRMTRRSSPNAAGSW